VHEICEAERYIPINFVKDLRGHIAAKRRSDFWGYPLPLASKFKTARTRHDQANNSGAIINQTNKSIKQTTQRKTI
jgi:hypothetical protein